MPIPLPRRRRGAQPGNRNAFTHGLYSARSPSSLAAISATLASIRSERRLSPETAIRNVPTLQSMAHAALRASADLSFPVTQLDLVTSLVNASVKLKTVYNNLPEVENSRENLLLVKAAETPMSLVCFSFCEHGITRDAYSFLDKLPRSDLNSTPSPSASRPFLEQPLFPSIPDRQWALIAHLIPPGEKTSRRGRPPADPRPLLGAIFWKFAHHARWQDLPVGSPSMLTCRRYYRRLFLSGRLFTIYRRLYTDFRRYSRLDLTALVKKGAFFIINKKVTLRSSLSETWYLRTALLFLQLAYQVRRRVHNRFMNSYYLPIANPRLVRLPRRRLPVGRVGRRPYRDPSIMPEQLSPTASFEPYVPVEASFA
jgi:transposase